MECALSYARLFCSCDLYLDLMTLVHISDLDITKNYLYNKT